MTSKTNLTINPQRLWDSLHGLATDAASGGDGK